jgi:HAD superfamily hydrolase (TIGR01549 family)
MPGKGAGMSKFSAVFFDLKGTLWDSAGCAEHVLKLVLPKLMPHLPEDTDDAEVARRFDAALVQGVQEEGLAPDNRFSSSERFRRLLESYGVDKKGLARELSTHYNHVRRLAMRNYVRPGAGDVLAELQERGLITGVITNGGPAIQRQLLRTLALDEHLDHVVIGGIEGHSKPDPRLFHRALKLAQIAAKNALYVGDTLATDVLGARRAGIPVAWLNPEQREVPPALPEPDYVIQELSRVLDLVQ